MLRESKLTLSDFIDQDHFELNSYLTHLFHLFEQKVPQR